MGEQHAPYFGQKSVKLKCRRVFRESLLHVDVSGFVRLAKYFQIALHRASVIKNMSFCLFKVIFYGFYHGKSPVNQHLGNVFYLFQASDQANVSFGSSFKSRALSFLPNSKLCPGNNFLVNLPSSKLAASMTVENHRFQYVGDTGTFSSGSSLFFGGIHSLKMGHVFAPPDQVWGGR